MTESFARFVRRRLERGAAYGLGFSAALVAVVLLVGIFLTLADAVLSDAALVRVDDRAHEILFGLVRANGDLAATVTFFGNNATIVTFVVLTALAFVLARRYGAAFRVVFASGLGGIVVVTLKQIFQRPRPVDPVIEAAGYSFPSGHAFASTVFYGMLVYLAWRLSDRVGVRALATVAGVGLFVTIGLSRVALNVHYLSDVLAGWAAGLAWLTLSLALIGAVERSRAEARR